MLHFLPSRRRAPGITNMKCLLMSLEETRKEPGSGIKGQEGSQTGSRLVRHHMVSLSSICFPESNTETVAAASALACVWGAGIVGVRALYPSSALTHASLTLALCSALHTSCLELLIHPFSSAQELLSSSTELASFFPLEFSVLGYSHRYVFALVVVVAEMPDTNNVRKEWCLPLTV